MWVMTQEVGTIELLLSSHTGKPVIFGYRLRCIVYTYILLNIVHYIFMLQFLKEEVLGYLEKWEKAVAARKGFQDNEKKNMLLSMETSNGMKITSESCINYSMILCIHLS